MRIKALSMLTSLALASALPLSAQDPSAPQPTTAEQPQVELPATPPDEGETLAEPATTPQQYEQAPAIEEQTEAEMQGAGTPDAVTNEPDLGSDEDLPKTASPLGLLALLALGGAGSAYSLRRTRKR